MTFRNGFPFLEFTWHPDSRLPSGGRGPLPPECQKALSAQAVVGLNSLFYFLSTLSILGHSTITTLQSFGRDSYFARIKIILSGFNLIFCAP
jgi:hypothetical protein